jgi:hypothetical protein
MYPIGIGTTKLLNGLLKLQHEKQIIELSALVRNLVVSSRERLRFDFVKSSTGFIKLKITCLTAQQSALPLPKQPGVRTYDEALR